MRNYYDTIIIGAGQAGLAMGYYLKKQNENFVLLEGNETCGNSWRTRYDSLLLFTPRSHSSLPGLKIDGNQNGYPTKDEIANYLENYAQKFELPIKVNTFVQNVCKINGYFNILTKNGDSYHSKQLVVATGPFQKPFIPSFSNNVPSEINQIHAADYKNSKSLSEGPVIVVGGGNSGLQIATELASDREVYLSTSKKPMYLPNEILNKSIFWWFKFLGISRLTTNSFLGKIVKNNDPIIGLESKPLIKAGKIKLLPKAVSFHEHSLVFKNKMTIKPKNIIWATGYYSCYRWLDFPHIFDDKGSPIHLRGVSKEDGLYFLGLPWQHRRGSALLLGVGEDAKYLAFKITDET